ncbi:hypothetical protein GGI06_002987 [Coemansia sp. S85]|nr:hypothetical protein GGI06_002987 [Coemansia sp. S85]
MREPVARLHYALTFRNSAGMDITEKVFGGPDEPKFIRLWLSRNLKREFNGKGIIKSKDATLTLFWTIPKDKQKGKTLGFSILEPLHNIEGTVKANRDFIDFSEGLFVMIRDETDPVSKDSPIVEAETVEASVVKAKVEESPKAKVKAEEGTKVKVKKEKSPKAKAKKEDDLATAVKGTVDGAMAAVKIEEGQIAPSA